MNCISSLLLLAKGLIISAVDVSISASAGFLQHAVGAWQHKGRVTNSEQE